MSTGASPNADDTSGLWSVRCWLESGRLNERHFDRVRNRGTAHPPGWECGPSPRCLLWEITRRGSKHPQTDPYPSGLMSLWLRVMWRDEWPRPTPSNAGVPGCEIACLIPSSISPSVTTKLPQPPHNPKAATVPIPHLLRLTPNLLDRCGSLMCRPSNPLAEQYHVPTQQEWWVRGSAWNEGNTHTTTGLRVCVRTSTPRANRSVRNQTTSNLAFPVVPSLSRASSLLYSHPWRVMINGVLSEFSAWPGLGDATVVPSRPPSATLHSFIASSLHQPSITSCPLALSAKTKKKKMDPLATNSSGRDW